MHVMWSACCELRRNGRTPKPLVVVVVPVSGRLISRLGLDFQGTLLHNTRLTITR